MTAQNKTNAFKCYANLKVGEDVNELCASCTLQGACRMRYVKALSNSEAEDPIIVWHMRKLAFDLVIDVGIHPSELPDWLTTKHARMDTVPVDDFNNPLVLKTKLLLPPDVEIEKDDAKGWNERRRDYYRRTWFECPPNYVMPVEEGYRDLFKLCGTLFLCLAPSIAITIPRHIKGARQGFDEALQAANDNHD